jgi:putative DNA-invertase from lambdoid prophage Rac
MAAIRAALYSRTSTADQHCENQQTELEAYCTARGWSFEHYKDHGFSGARTSRPAFDRLIADARKRKIDAVLVVKLDRFGRSLVHCISAIQELQSLGVRFIATTQGIDTDKSNPAATLLMHILASVAAFERELIRERIAAGIRNARTRGKRLGRPPAVMDRLKARELRDAGRSLRSIAAELSVPKSVVDRALRNDSRP